MQIITQFFVLFIILSVIIILIGYIAYNNSLVSGEKPTDKKLFTNHFWYEFISILVPVIVIVAIVNVVFSVSRCLSASMENTIMTDDVVIQNKLAYMLHSPMRGDIICFKNDQTCDEMFVKRIIGLPGDIVSFDEGKVYINDEVLDEPYLEEDIETYSYILAFVVPENKYFVLGDNREISDDSRRWANPYVDRNDITSRVIGHFSPPLHFLWES